MYIRSVLCFAAKPRLQYMYANCLLCILCSNVHMIGLILVNMQIWWSLHVSQKRPNLLNYTKCANEIIP